MNKPIEEILLPKPQARPRIYAYDIADTYQMPDELVAIASGGKFDEFDLNAFSRRRGEAC